MKKILMSVMISLASCFAIPAPMTEDALEPVQLQVLIMPVNQGCALSKVRVYDDMGNLYQVEGCNDGILTLAEGRSFGWVELFGVQTIGWSVYQIR